MEDGRNPGIPADRRPRATRREEIDEELLDESHARGPSRELLVERESATERFRALKRRLLARG